MKKSTVTIDFLFGMPSLAFTEKQVAQALIFLAHSTRKYDISNLLLHALLQVVMIPFENRKLFLGSNECQHHAEYRNVWCMESDNKNVRSTGRSLN